MNWIRLRAGRTFQSLRSRNYRLFFAGMSVSAIGSWMQLIAQGWLVVQLGGKGVALGTLTALQFVPTLVGGAWGGLLADRLDKRRLVIRTQVASGALALVLGVATGTGVVTLGLVYVLAFLLGCVNAVDNPTRRAFLAELVEPEDVANAVALNTAMFTSARVIGPALAGLTIGAFGTAPCFYLNAASFVAVVIALRRLDPATLHPSMPAVRAPGQVREGVRYAWANPDIRLVLIMTAVISTFAFNYQVVLPLMAAEVFEGGAGTYGLLFAVLSVGSVIGSLVTAGGATATRAFVLGTTVVLGLATLAAAAAPSLAAELVAIMPVGAAGAAFSVSTNAIAQEAVRPDLRGRVMALLTVVFLGSTPIGGPLVGAAAEVWGARSGFVIGGVAALATAAVVVAFGTRRRRAPALAGA